MLKWIHQLFNPHCVHCREELIESKQCNSCDTLIRQLDIKTNECEVLLNKLINPSVKEVVETGPVQMTRPTRNLTWNVRRQMLEAEDRKKAELLRAVPKPSTNNTDIEELEKELGVDDALQEVRKE